MIIIINPVVTSKGKFPEAVDNKFLQGIVKGTSQWAEKTCSKAKDLEEDTLDTLVDCKTLREIIHTLPFTFQFSRNLKPEEWKDMDQALQIHQLLRDLFQWSMDSRFNLESHWAELEASCQKICLKELSFKDLMVINEGWNPTRKFRLLEERETKIRSNKATIQALEERINQTEPTLIASGSQGVDQPSSPMASHHSGTSSSVAKSHHSSQSQVASRRRE
ncbi:hypothetical protein O181_022856 [Austropuccinia psidii MF-1]|uniref:Uncharacterized protein n=1 Tax=Austropuccinia psidii MF-1 TaxID=1389203 RepID=A0A9Q3CIA7_9BASI|nr:hypothetical protein [Austropuccinia psidii MF-1]